MSALYTMQYQGHVGSGGGAIYIGKGIVLGVDVSGARYNGSLASLIAYVEPRRRNFERE
jgi:hypothetical protein